MMRRRPGPDDVGTRLDTWLAGSLPGVSRARVRLLIEDGHVQAAGKRLTPHTRVTRDLEVKIEIPEPSPVELVPQDIPLRILYRDTDLVVIDKQAGLVVHPAAGHSEGTLVNALLFHCRDLEGIGGELRPGIVHRLDKDTTGVMVVAKNEAAMAALKSAFQEGDVRKEYLALVRGVPTPRNGTIDTLIGRSRHDRKKMSALPATGRRAITHYEVAEAFDGAALVRVRIETGRTHQIRVHMAHIHHPVLGDRQYGRRAGLPAKGGMRYPSRQMLHAHALELPHPSTGEKVRWTAPIPGDMQALLDELRHGGA